MAESRAVHNARLRRWVLSCFDEVISGVRAYAEVCAPGTTLLLLPILATLREAHRAFERHTQERS